MIYGIGVAVIELLLVIGLLLVLIIGFGLVLAECGRNKGCRECREHIPSGTIPAARNMPPPPPNKKD